MGSLTIASNKIIANKPNIGVIRKPHCHAPVVLAASPPIIYPKPLKDKLYVNLYIKFKIIFLFLFIFVYYLTTKTYYNINMNKNLNLPSNRYCKVK